jgi:hypothetical protein
MPTVQLASSFCKLHNIIYKLINTHTLTPIKYTYSNSTLYKHISRTKAADYDIHKIPTDTFVITRFEDLESEPLVFTFYPWSLLLEVGGAMDRLC